MSFGGDPDNVMIFGQSGGGAKVVTMLQSKKAAGLFHRACVQSGGMRHTEDITPELSQRLAAFVLEEMGILPEHVKEIERVFYEELALAADCAMKRLSKETGKRIMFGPVTDHVFYSGHPYRNGFIRETLDTPLLCGSVFGEFLNNFASPVGEGSKNSWTPEYIRHLLIQEYGDKADALIASFTETYPDKTPADLLFLDAQMRRDTLEFARLRALSSKAGVYNFLFNLESPFNGGTVPWHNAEIPYIFHNAEYLEASFIPGITPELQDIVSGAWVNFAKTGDPNGIGVPLWKAVTQKEDNTMIFDRKCSCRANHDRELIAVLPVRNVDFSKLMGKKK